MKNENGKKNPTPPIKWKGGGNSGRRAKTEKTARSSNRNLCGTKGTSKKKRNRPWGHQKTGPYGKKEKKGWDAKNPHQEGSRKGPAGEKIGPEKGK